MNISQKELSRKIMLKIYINGAYFFSGVSLVCLIDYFKFTTADKQLIIALVYFLFLILTVIWPVIVLSKKKHKSDQNQRNPSQDIENP